MTTTARHTATRHALAHLIGRPVTVRLTEYKNIDSAAFQPDPDPRHVRVRVRDIATPYGKARLLVEPLTGTGETWISADKLVSPTPDDEPPADPTAVVTVVNLATSQELTYVGLTPRQAVTAAAEADRGNRDTTTYPLLAHLAEMSTSGQSISRGDFAALTTKRKTDKGA